MAVDTIFVQIIFCNKFLKCLAVLVIYDDSHIAVPQKAYSDMHDGPDEETTKKKFFTTAFYNLKLFTIADSHMPEKQNKCCFLKRNPLQK